MQFHLNSWDVLKIVVPNYHLTQLFMFFLCTMLTLVNNLPLGVNMGILVQPTALKPPETKRQMNSRNDFIYPSSHESASQDIDSTFGFILPSTGVFPSSASHALTQNLRKRIGFSNLPMPRLRGSFKILHVRV